MIWAFVFHLLALVQLTYGVCEKPATSPKEEYKSVCYPLVGCFDDKPPFNNALGELPRSPEELGVKFKLHTRETDAGNITEFVDYRNASTVTSSRYDARKPLKVVIHGFDNNGKSPWIAAMKDALLKRGDFNVLVIDWGEGAKLPNYNGAVANLRLVGTQIKLILDIMVKEGANLKDVHLIGHSLGAHMAGYIGLLTGSAIGRISGMDPAEPDFECLPTLIRLDAGDAIFVDVIHTNGEPLVAGGAGLFQQSGHVDFYANGGKTQPGCKDGVGGVFSSIFSHGFSSLGDGISCSHARSHEIFTESINTHCPFTGFPCENYDKFAKGECLTCRDGGCSSMGYFSNDFYTHGRMFLKTRASPPYCGYHYAVEVETSNTTKTTKGTIYASLQGRFGSTEFAAVTPVDESLQKSDTLRNVAVFEQDAGPIKSIKLKYKQYGGYGVGFFRIGKGEDSFAVQKAKVISGETGESFEFQFGDSELRHNVEKMITLV